jgi:hypothetical protein
VVRLKKRVGGKLSRLDVPGELLQRKPPGVPVASISQSRKSPHLRGIVVVDMPFPAMILFELLEDSAISIGTHLDVGLTVRGRSMEEVPIGPGFPGRGTKSSNTYSKLKGKSTQHRDALGRLTTHHQSATVLDCRAAVGLTPSPPIQQRTEQTTELR